MARETWDCVILGVEEVEAGFRRIGRARQEAEGRGSAGGGAGRSTDTALQAASRRAERQAASEGRAAERAAAQKARAAERAARDQERAARKAEKAEEQAQARVVKAHEKAEREKVRAAEKAMRETERLAKREETARKRRALLDEMDRSRRRAGIVGGVAGAITNQALSIGRAGYTKMMALSEEGVRQQLELGTIARRVSINARAPGEQAINPNQLKREFTDVSAQVKGVITPAQIGEAVQAFITKTGDVGKAREFTPDVAQMAVAADASIESVSKTAADLFQKFGVETRADMQKALASLYFGGKAGAFELSDFAEKMAPIASAGQRFGVDKGVRGVQIMSGLSQIAMEATGERDVAATAVSAALSQMIANTDKIRKLTAGAGLKPVQVFDRSSNKTRKIEELLPEIIAQTGGLNAEKKAAGLQDIFNERGIKAISPLISEFMKGAQASAVEGGTKAEQMAAGKAAVEAKLNAAIDATGAWTEVLQDSVNAQSDDAAQLSTMWNNLKAEIGDQLIPSLKEAAPNLVTLAEAAVPLIEIVADLASVFSAVIKQLREWGLVSEKSQKATRAGLEPEKEFAQIQKSLKEKGLSEFSAPVETRARMRELRQSITEKETVRDYQSAIYGNAVPDYGATAALRDVVRAGDVTALPESIQRAAKTGDVTGVTDADKAMAAFAIQVRATANALSGLQDIAPKPTVFAGG